MVVRLLSYSNACDLFFCHASTCIHAPLPFTTHHAPQGVYVFYLDLVTTMLHLVVYLFFFIIVFNHYGLPLHLMRDLYWTFRNFRNRVSDFLRYRRVTVNMDSRFPEATAEVRAAGSVCYVTLFSVDMRPLVFG